MHGEDAWRDVGRDVGRHLRRWPAGLIALFDGRRSGTQSRADGRADGRFTVTTLLVVVTDRTLISRYRAVRRLVVSEQSSIIIDD